MVKEKIIVFISEPTWNEKPIPNWINKGIHIILTESDTVINECLKRNLEFYTLGENIKSDRNIYLVNKSINIEKDEQNKIESLCFKDKYITEFYHGISAQLYYFFYYQEIITNIFNKYRFRKLIFIVGDRMMASIDETPKGCYLQYIYFKLACKKNNIQFQKRYHQTYNYKEINLINKRYDFYFSFNNERNLQFPIKKLITNYDPKSLKPKTLFIYQYEACKDDLEPLLFKELTNTNVLKLKLTSSAPPLYDYDFDLTSIKKYTNDSTLEYDFKVLKDIFFNNLQFENKEQISPVIEKYFKYNKSIIQITISHIIEINKIINDFKISKIVITAFPSSSTSLIAKYFTLKNIKVILRQHGEFSSPNWPIKCFVSGVEFSTISNFYKSYLEKYTDNITITPRNYKQPLPILNEEIKNTIIITNDLFLNPTNKLLVVNFFKNIIKILTKKYLIKFRSHPRYFGDILSNLEIQQFTNENSREIDLTTSFKNCFLFIMPVDTFSSIISAPIGFDIPSVMIAPKGSVSVFDFQPLYFDYPFIFDDENSLNNFILKIETDQDFKKDVLFKQKKWLTSILDENINPAMIENANDRIVFKSKNIHINKLDFFKLRLKYLIKSLKNYHL